MKAIISSLPGISIAFLACAAALSVSASPLIVQWKNAETTLMESYSEDVNNPFKTNDLFKKIASTGDERIFLEMTVHPDCPAVAVAGFVCLKQQFPKEVVSAAMRMVLEMKLQPTLEFYAPIFEFLRTNQDQAALESGLASVAGGASLQAPNFGLLIGMLPYQTVYKFFDDPARPALSATTEAVMLDRLIGEAAENKATISSNMAAVLNRMQFIPGRPRGIFVLYANADKATLLANLRLVLEDPNPDTAELLTLFVRKRQMIEEALAADSNIPPATRKLVGNWLKKNKQPK